MSYHPHFVSLINNYIEKSTDFYQIDANKNKPNPYYLGFGNPNAKILIIGKEKGFDPKTNSDQLLKESMENVIQWKHIIDESIISLDYRHYSDQGIFYNPLHPYYSSYIKGKGQGQTWYYV